MNCPKCGATMASGFLYVRGVGGALFWGESPDVGFLSRKGLEQIDLSAVSLAGTGTQAVIESWRCGGCGIVAFRGES
jgi:hypothetical protein